MAHFEPLAQFILSFEGGFVNDPKDRGGATNRGVTIGTWRSQGYDKNGDGVIDVKDLRLITAEDATRIMRRNYWNRYRADSINDQSVANILVDWLWLSGRWAIVLVQEMLGLKADGIVGPKTIAAINSVSPAALFVRIKDRRVRYIDDLIKRKPSQKHFENGWRRRLDAIRYGSMIDNNKNKITW